MIRKATLNDLDGIVEIGVEFAIKSQAITHMAANTERIRETSKNAIENENSIMLVIDDNGKVDGVAFGIIQKPYFSEDLVCQELALYTRKVTRLIHLIEAFENEALNKGAKLIVMGSKPDYCDLGKIYKRRGYKILEEHYIKRS